METSAKVRFFGGTWSYYNLIFSFLSALPWRAAACGCILKKDYLEFEMQYLQFKFQVTLLKGGWHTPLSGRADVFLTKRLPEMKESPVTASGL